MSSLPLPQLTALQARVVAVLFEKEHTVPDTYPLSLNALVAGCNQKTSRDPVMDTSEREVQQALDELRQRSLVIESSGGRVMRYSHNLKRVLGVPSESVALLVTLMLRGPQTPGELRINCDRLQRFSDLSAMNGFLEELASRSQGVMPSSPRSCARLSAIRASSISSTSTRWASRSISAACSSLPPDRVFALLAGWLSSASLGAPESKCIHRDSRAPGWRGSSWTIAP